MRIERIGKYKVTTITRRTIITRTISITITTSTTTTTITTLSTITTSTITIERNGSRINQDDDDDNISIILQWIGGEKSTKC